MLLFRLITIALALLTFCAYSKGPKEENSKSPSKTSKSTAKLPWRIPPKIPSRTPSQTPPKITSQVPSKQLRKVRTQSGNVKWVSKSLSKEPSKISSESPSKSPWKIPSKIPSKVSSKIPFEATLRVSSKIPSKIPSKVPSSSPSKNPIAMDSKSSSPVRIQIVGTYLGGKTWRNLAGPNPKEARTILNLVTNHNHKIYTENMKKRGNLYSKATKVRERFERGDTEQSSKHDSDRSSKRSSEQSITQWRPWKDNPQSLRYKRERYIRQGKRAYNRAYKAARTNRIMASTIKDIKTAHRPRWNDFRRWGHESVYSTDLSRITWPSSQMSIGCSWSPRVNSPPSAPFRSSRTYSTGPPDNPWGMKGYVVSTHGKPYGWPAFDRTESSSSPGHALDGASWPGGWGPRQSQSLGSMSGISSSESRKAPSGAGSGKGHK